ncbi:hypothetical protein AAXB25_29135 [Paenibacillus lautus]
MRLVGLDVSAESASLGRSLLADRGAARLRCVDMMLPDAQAIMNLLQI